MKKVMVLLIAATALIASANAQVNVGVNINIGSQPVWGPVGYDHVDYYYLPDQDIYYYVPERVYIYQNGNSWKRSRVLPAQYQTINLYQTHKVVINNVDRPYLQGDKYRQQYAGFKGKHDQVAIRDSKEEKYFVNKKHPQHAAWVKTHGNGKGKAKGHGKH